MLLVSGGAVEAKSSSLVLVKVSHSSGAQRITFAEVKDGVRSRLSVVLLDISVKVNKFIVSFINRFPHDSSVVLRIKILQSPLSINSLELVVQGIEMVVHGGTDSVHTLALGGIESLLRSIEELAGNTLLLVSGSTIEVKVGSLILVEVGNRGGGQRIALAEVKDRVGSGLSVVLLHIRFEVGKGHVLQVLHIPSLWDSEPSLLTNTPQVNVRV